jgi:uncharacterized membrane protein
MDHFAGGRPRNVFSLYGKDVLLPEGKYKVVSIGMADMAQPAYGTKVNPQSYGPTRRVVLARVAEGGVTSVVEVVANTLPSSDGWGISTDCYRSDIYATLVHYKTGWDVSCLWIKPFQVSADDTFQGLEDLRLFAMREQAKLPDFFIESGFRVSNRHDVVDVRYRFAPPALSGVPGEGVDVDKWAPASIADQPTELEQVQAIAAWAGAVYPTVETGLRAKLPTDVATLTPFLPIDGGETDRVRRITELKVLREAGTISDAEFSRQEAIIKAEVEPVLENAWTYATVAGYKAFTYRVAVTTINAGIDWIFIGRPFAAGVLVVLQVVVNTTKFIFHEVTWQELFDAGPLQRDNPRLMNFVAQQSTLAK